MTISPFITPYESLPDTLAVFPLPGAIIMPGAELPLNIFEPRYLNMINDALGSHRMIGMIQPDPAADNDIDLCHSGCAARISQYRETGDGRIEMVLSGVCRFDVKEEMSTTRGYRMIVPEWTRFAGDYDDRSDRLQDRHAELMATLKSYFMAQKLEANLVALEKLPASQLVDSLSMALPFSVAEKQMLLETVDIEVRLDNFLALIAGDFDVPDSVTRH